MIIIDGPDLVGKSSLCKKLINSPQLMHGGYTLAHLSRLPDSFDRFWSYTQRAIPTTVQDRFHMSEVMYAMMRGEPTVLTPEKYRLVDGMLRLRGALHVLVVMEDSDVGQAILRERYSQLREREMYREQQVLLVNTLFCNVADRDGDFQCYQMDLDYVIRCGPDKLFPAESDVSEILRLHAKRQDALGRVMNTRTGMLEIT